MRKIAFIALAILLPGCGKFLDKFSRNEGGFTEVRIANDLGLSATMNGGLMIYFGREGDNQGGFARGFTSSELAQGKSIQLPNGNYKVWAFGSEEGTSKILQGQAKCGIGNGGAVFVLTGGSRTLDINVSAANCAFGTNSPFGDVNTANSGNTNFDTMNFQACSTTAYTTCDTNTGANFRVRLRLLAGEKPPNSAPFVVNAQESLVTSCSSASASGIITSSYLAMSGGEELSPPIELQVYTDPTCSGAIAAKFVFEDGLRHYRLANVSEGALFFMDSPASLNTSTLFFKYP